MLIVVGMNPSNNTKTHKINKNSTFDRLYKWMDQLGVKHYSFINCSNYQNDKISSEEVDYHVLELCKGYPKVIALGGFASDCLKKVGVAHFKLPHPSPRNRLLNDKEYEISVIQQCKEYMERN